MEVLFVHISCVFVVFCLFLESERKNIKFDRSGGGEDLGGDEGGGPRIRIYV